MQDLENLRKRLLQEEAALETTHKQIDTARRQVEALRHKIQTEKEQVEAIELRLEELGGRRDTIERRIALLREHLAALEAGNELAPTSRPAAAAPPPPTAEGAAAEGAEKEPLTFANIDDNFLTRELLPRTQSFTEELLLVLAAEGKALTPKNIARLFRRIDYMPKHAPTEKGIKAKVESEYRRFAFSAGGRVVLTEEGEEEAQQLLKRLIE